MSRFDIIREAIKQRGFINAEDSSRCAEARYELDQLEADYNRLLKKVNQLDESRKGREA